MAKGTHQITKKFFKDTTLYTIAKLLVTLRGIIILPLFSRTVGTEGYGLFSQIIITVILLTHFFSFQLDIASVRYLSGERDKKTFQDSFYSALIFVAFSGVFILVLMMAFREETALIMFGGKEYTNFVIVGSLFLLFNILSENILNFFRIINRIDLLSYIKFSQTAIEIALILLLVSIGHSIVYVIGIMIVIRVVLIVFVSPIILKQIGLPVLKWGKLKPMLKYSIPLMPNGLMNWAVNYADRLVIVQYLSIAAIGTYSASYSFGSLLNSIVGPIGFVLFPLVSKLWDQNKKEETKNYFLRITRYFIMVALPASLGLAMLSQPLLKIFATAQFTSSTFLVLWIALGVMFKGIFQINVYVFHLVHKTKYVAVILLIGVLANIGLNILLVPKIGIEGAAVATLVTYIFIGLSAVYYGRIFLGYHLDLGAIGKVGVSTIIMAGIIHFIPSDSLLMIFINIITGVILYFIVLYLVGGFLDEEVDYVKQRIFALTRCN